MSDTSFRRVEWKQLQNGQGGSLAGVLPIAQAVDVGSSVDADGDQQGMGFPVQSGADPFPFCYLDAHAVEDRTRGVAMHRRLHPYLVTGRSHLHLGFEARPRPWNAGIDDKERALATEAQNALDPSSSTAIPSAWC